MPAQLSRAAAIVGAAEANEIGFLDEPVTALQLHIEAIKNVSEQTGIPISRIEGVFSTGWSTELCEHLGITPKYIDTTAVGGCSFEMHVHHALAAIYSGIIDVALISHGENGHSARKIGSGGGNYGRGAGTASPSAEMTMAYGLGSAPSNYAHAMVRHMHRYGNSTEDYAHIAKVTRDWATLTRVSLSPCNSRTGADISPILLTGEFRFMNRSCSGSVGSPTSFLIRARVASTRSSASSIAGMSLTPAILTIHLYDSGR